jgi:predicted dehydrogenase
VAARDWRKAKTYAKKHNIPQVMSSYEGRHSKCFVLCSVNIGWWLTVATSGLLDDSSIDVIYIPLPAGLHYEWALKALAKGKHVIIEKPATVNAVEAQLLHRSPVLQQPNAPILLEAMHFRFQPSWQYFLSLVDLSNIQVVNAVAKLPSYIIPKGGIRFDYDLGGGNILDLGTYPMYALRQIMGAEPEECTMCKTRTPPPPHQLCDEFAEASFSFPGGRIGHALMDMRAPVTTLPTFNVMVSHNEVELKDSTIPEGQKKVMARKLIFSNFLMSSFWHRIDIIDEFTIRETKGGQVIKRWSTKQCKKIYTFKDAGIDMPGEPFWTSYRHQLEQFVNRVRGHKSSGLWVSNEDSLAQAKMIDMAYEKSGLPLRPTSNFKLNDGTESLIH